MYAAVVAVVHASMRVYMCDGSQVRIHIGWLVLVRAVLPRLAAVLRWLQCSLINACMHALACVCARTHTCAHGHTNIVGGDGDADVPCVVVVVMECVVVDACMYMCAHVTTTVNGSANTNHHVMVMSPILPSDTGAELCATHGDGDVAAATPTSSVGRHASIVCAATTSSDDKTTVAIAEQYNGCC